MILNEIKIKIYSNETFEYIFDETLHIILDNDDIKSKNLTPIVKYNNYNIIHWNTINLIPLCNFTQNNITNYVIIACDYDIITPDTKIPSIRQFFIIEKDLWYTDTYTIKNKLSQLIRHKFHILYKDSNIIITNIEKIPTQDFRK